MYFGFELELKNDEDSDLARTIMEDYSFNKEQNENLVYLKRDSSIESRFGFEMVSHPMSYEFIKEDGSYAIEEGFYDATDFKDGYAILKKGKKTFVKVIK